MVSDFIQPWISWVAVMTEVKVNKGSRGRYQSRAEIDNRCLQRKSAKCSKSVTLRPFSFLLAGFQILLILNRQQCVFSVYLPKAVCIETQKHTKKPPNPDFRRYASVLRDICQIEPLFIQPASHSFFSWLILYISNQLVFLMNTSMSCLTFSLVSIES